MEKIFVFLLKNDGSASSDERILQCAKQLDIPCSKVIRNGKPTLDNPNAHFSVSHSGDVWLCAFSSSPIGADIQQHNSVEYKKISRRFFTPGEQKIVRDELSFFDVWTKKEALVKFTGRGLRDLKIADTENCPMRFIKLDIAPGYSTHICTQSEHETEIIDYMR